MQFSRREQKRLLRTFGEGEHDWKSFFSFTNATPDEVRQESLRRYLCDKGLLERLSRRSAVEVGDMGKGDDGRIITYELTYRITASGRDFAAPTWWQWWNTQTAKLADNVVTIIVSVATALIVAWALNIFGPPSVDDGSANIETTER